MNVVAIIQARLNSHRFPAKVLAPLCGVPVIDRVIDSVKLGMNFDSKVVLATTATQADNPLAAHVMHRIPVFRGCAENDVLARYYECAFEHQADVIVRVTGDCPLVDPVRIRWMVSDFLEGGVDYFGITNQPDGCDVEVFSMDALRDAFVNATLSEFREHVTGHIREFGDCMNYPPMGMGDVKFSIDDLADFRLCEELIQRCGDFAGVEAYVKAARELRSAGRSTP